MITFTPIPWGARALGFLGGIRLYLLVGAAAALAGSIGGGLLMGKLKDSRIAELKAKHAAAQAEAVTAALARVQAQNQVTADVGREAAEAQVRIETRYRTLREKVSIYVPVHTPAGVIGANDLVPVGAIRLLDAAAAGSDPDSVSVTAGRTLDVSSGVTFSRLTGDVVDNYGLANQNARQLSDLQEWIRKQQAVGP